MQATGRIAEPSSPEEFDALVPLFAAQCREHGIETSNDALRRVLWLIRQHPESGFVLAAFVEQEPVGVAYAAAILSLEHGGASGWLEELYVRETARESGWGTRLLDAVIEEARRRRWAALDLEVDENHRRAVPLYIRLGFGFVPRARYVRRLLTTEIFPSPTEEPSSA